MNILVVGGAGYIGSHVTYEFCDQGYKVTVVDNLSSGFVDNIDKRADFVENSFVDLSDNILKDIDCVIHLAALKAAGDFEGLQKLPKDASPVRMHNRCKITGRPKGYIRQFGISRVIFREMANKGLIPGVTKASW